MSRRIIVIHGTGGSPEGNWFPWLANQATSSHVQAIVPRFSPPATQNIERWRAVFNETVGPLTSSDILIGHSIGAAFALRMLEETESKIRATFIVSPFCRQLGNTSFDPYNASFLLPPFLWSKIRARCAQFIAYTGDNDPYVPLAFAEESAGALNAPLRIIRNGGHLNGESGYFEFPALLRDIRTVLESN